MTDNLNTLSSLIKLESIDSYDTSISNSIINRNYIETVNKLKQIRHPDIITNDTNITHFINADLTHQLSFINPTFESIDNDIPIKHAEYDGFGGYSTLQGFQQNLPFITFKLGSNRHRERPVTSTKEEPVLVLEISRQYLNTLLKIKQENDSEYGYVYEDLNNGDTNYENYIEISHKEIRHQLFKTALSPNNFGKIPNISSINGNSDTPESIKTFITDNIIEDKDIHDGFAQANDINIFKLPFNLVNVDHNYGQIRVKEVNELKDIYIDYHDNIMKDFFKIDDIDEEMYNMFIIDRSELEVDQDRMAAIIITQGLNLDSDLGIDTSDGVLELQHLTALDLQNNSSDTPDNNQILLNAIIDDTIDDIDETTIDTNKGVRIYDCMEQILDASIAMNQLTNTTRNVEHGFCGGDIILIPQLQEFFISTKIVNYVVPQLTDEKKIKLLFEVVDVIDQNETDLNLKHQDTYGDEVIEYLKTEPDTNDSTINKFDTLDYSDFKTLLGIDSTDLLIGIDEPGELDYDKILVNLGDGIDDSTFPTVELDPFTHTFTNPVNSTIPNPDNS